MPDRDLYALETLRIPERYRLSNNAVLLLRTYNDFRAGAIDEDEVGRRMRLSPNLRKALSDTVAACTKIMENDAAEVSICADIIRKYTNLLKIAGVDSPSRMKVVNQYLRGSFLLGKKINLLIPRACRS